MLPNYPQLVKSNRDMAQRTFRRTVKMPPERVPTSRQVADKWARFPHSEEFATYACTGHPHDLWDGSLSKARK